MWKLSLVIALIFSVNANAQTTSTKIISQRKARSTKTDKQSVFSNSIFIKGGIGITSAQVDEWESTTYPPSSSTGGGLGGGSWFQSSGPIPTHHYNSVRREFTTVSFKIGNKWILGSNEKWRPGVQLTWFKYTAFIPVNEGDFKRSFSFVMLGFNNTFKLSENSALEFNGDYGLSFTKNNLKGESSPRTKGVGLSYDFELNYRYKKFTVGIDFSSIHRGAQISTDWTSLHTIGVGIGLVI